MRSASMIPAHRFVSTCLRPNPARITSACRCQRSHREHIEPGKRRSISCRACPRQSLGVQPVMPRNSCKRARRTSRARRNCHNSKRMPAKSRAHLSSRRGQVAADARSLEVRICARVHVSPTSRATSRFDVLSIPSRGHRVEPMKDWQTKSEEPLPFKDADDPALGDGWF